MQRVLIMIPLLLVTMPSFADKTGFAMNGGIGGSQIRDTDGDDSFNGNSVGFVLGVEYRFIPYFALGVNWFSLGTAEDEFGGVDTEIKVRGIDIAGRLIWPVSEKVELYGLLGGASYYADLDPGGSNGLFGDDAWEYGLGADFDTSEDFSIRVEGRYFDGTRAEYGALLTIGFAYRF